jgi:hypothetical protein
LLPVICLPLARLTRYRKDFVSPQDGKVLVLLLDLVSYCRLVFHWSLSEFVSTGECGVRVWSYLSFLSDSNDEFFDEGRFVVYIFERLGFLRGEFIAEDKGPDLAASALNVCAVYIESLNR